MVPDSPPYYMYIQAHSPHYYSPETSSPQGTATYTHSDHNTSPDYSHSTHTGSVRLPCTHPPAGTSLSQGCKTWPANNTAPSPRHTSAPYTSGGFLYPPRSSSTRSFPWINLIPPALLPPIIQENPN